jgi:hypothetical protein
MLEYYITLVHYKCTLIHALDTTGEGQAVAYMVVWSFLAELLTFAGNRGQDLLNSHPNGSQTIVSMHGPIGPTYYI